MGIFKDAGFGGEGRIWLINVSQNDTYTHDCKRQRKL